MKPLTIVGEPSLGPIFGPLLSHPFDLHDLRFVLDLCNHFPCPLD